MYVCIVSSISQVYVSHVCFIMHWLQLEL